MLNGFFDIDNRLEYLTENGDILPNLEKLVPWEDFRKELEVIYEHERKSNAGRRPFDVVMMFKEDSTEKSKQKVGFFSLGDLEK